jgi:hypothetical protein
VEGEWVSPDSLPPVPARCPPPRSLSGNVGSPTTRVFAAPTATFDKAASLRWHSSGANRGTMGICRRAHAALRHAPAIRRLSFSELSSSSAAPGAAVQPGRLHGGRGIPMLVAKLEHTTPRTDGRRLRPQLRPRHYYQARGGQDPPRHGQ